MELSVFEFNVDSGVAHIRINQPELGNPINAAFCEEFNQLSIECGENKEIRCVLIDAAGKNFGVGGDLKEFVSDLDRLPRSFKQMTANLHMGVARFARNDAPVVVAAQGLVVGGSLALVAAADFAYATPESRFYTAFAAVGFCGDTGVSHFLPRRIGSRKATEFMLLNEMWDAQKAADAQLVNGLVAADELADHCRALATRLAKGPTEVYGRMRRLLLSSFDQPIDTQLEMEARGMVESARSEVARAAIKKLLEK